MIAGVDVIVAGGGRELLANGDDRLIPGDEGAIAGAYPAEATDMDGNTVYLVTTSGEYRYAGHLYLEFDNDGAVKAIEDASGPIVVDRRFMEDQEMIDRVVNPVLAHVDGLETDIIADNQVPLDGTRANVRSTETNLGNLSADAILWGANNQATAFGTDAADVALHMGGGIVNNSVIPTGDFAEAQTFEISPSLSFVSIVRSVSPEKFKEIVENSFARIVEGESEKYPHVAGFVAEYDPNGTAQVVDPATGTVTTPGSRVWSITMINASSGDSIAIVEAGEVAAGAPNVNMAVIDSTARGSRDFPYAGLGFDVVGTTFQQVLSEYIQAPAFGDASIDGLAGEITSAQYPEGGEGRISEKDPDAVGLEDIEAQGFVVYPNPSSDVVNIMLSERWAAKNIEVEFLTMMGQRVNKVAAISSTSFDISALPAGVYIVKLISGSESVQQRVVKE
jgi:5'-nucleotidase